MFEQVESQVQFGDYKASLLVAGDAILLAAGGGLVKVVSGCEQKELAVDCMVPSVPLGLAAIAAALLVVSMGCALWTIRPAWIHWDPPPSQLFLLSSVAQMKPEEFVEAYKATSFDDLAEKALIAIHGKADYATKKFWWLDLTIYATLLSLGFIVVTSLVAIAARAFA